MKISVKMTARDLFTFSMYNSYTGFMGFFNIGFSLAALVLLIVTWDWPQAVWHQKLLMGFCALLFSVIQPCLLWNKSKKQAQAHGFSTPVNLTLSDDGVFVEQAGVTGDMPWKYVTKIVRLKSMYIIKVGPGRAYLVPNDTIEGREQEFVDILKRNLPEKKTKGLKA